jgi:hypothetical protein
LCVRIDGRVIWGLYPFLVPFAVVALERLANVKGTFPSVSLLPRKGR